MVAVGSVELMQRAQHEFIFMGKGLGSRNGN